MFLTIEGAKEIITLLETLPGVLVKRAEAEAAKIEQRLETRWAAIEAKIETDVLSGLDDKVKAALEAMAGDGIDLSGLKSAIGGLSGDDLGDADDEGGVETDAPKPTDSATATNDAKKADLPTLAGPAAVDAPPPKVDPAAAGQAAANAALAAGLDPVPAAAAAAHAAATDIGLDPVTAATDAAAAAGAGPVEAQRAAQAVQNAAASA